MLDKLRTLLEAVNARLVLAGVVVAVALNELTPHVGLHPAIEWAVRVLGSAAVVLEAARRILSRSTEVPAVMRGLAAPEVQTAAWTDPHGGSYSYIGPRRPGLRKPGDVGGVITRADRPPPPPTAA